MLSRGRASAADYGVGTKKSALDLIAVDEGNFDYHKQIGVEVSQKNFKDFWIRPIGGVVNQAGPFTFQIEPSTDQYLQLNRARLEVQARVVGPAGNTLSTWQDIVAPVNLLGATMWETVEVFLNDHPFVGSSSINAGYKAYVETMLSYDTDAANTHLQTQFFYLDSPNEYGNMKVPLSTIRKNVMRAIMNGEEERPGPNLIAPDKRADPLYQDPDGDDAEILQLDDSEWDHMQVTISSELEDEGAALGLEQDDEDEATQQRRFVYEERQKKLFRWEAYRSYFTKTWKDIIHRLGVRKDKFVNHGFKTRYQIINGSHPFDMYSPIMHDFFRLDNHVGPGNKITVRLSMYPHSFLLNSYLPDPYRLEILDMKMHLHTIERRERIPTPLTEKYRMNQTIMNRQLVAENIPSTTFRIHNGGVLPKTIIVGMVYQRAAEGAYNYNPFNFHHFHLNRMAFIINGETYPSDGLRFNFRGANRMVSRGYAWTFENTGAFDGERGNVITMEAFKGGCFLVCTDMSPDKCNMKHEHDAQYGYIDLSLEFDVPTPEPVYVYYEMVFNKVILNNKMENEVVVLDIEAGV